MCTASPVEEIHQNFELILEEIEDNLFYLQITAGTVTIQCSTIDRSNLDSIAAWLERFGERNLKSLEIELGKVIVFFGTNDGTLRIGLWDGKPPPAPTCITVEFSGVGAERLLHSFSEAYRAVVE